MDPLRGEVWMVGFPGAGEHPAVVLSINRLNARLGAIAVVPVTGTAGPTETHIAIGADAGLTKYDESYADVTGVQVVAKGRFRRRRGLTHPGELARIEQQVRVYLGL
ncbi:type II toxin-antitoxin system PemK/MazF family toxin [Actinomycetospora termitidis]|uniref:Type II toxin-antitoxin system PemK/MazF family toxin n=1 Tax=Actinomycetospora termitidis TaxID=3053470 RepID=A0ABT7MA31_9PSEU|nr:type II toxin-antitoxin system PemK/MazF family toxin [Actinomycetospora sp. Odt1-22]MDL5156692.1 type II toxin-antitoxin system PemK/MazF family toxin [Actinomycetospora sp. Odt1-22]